MKPKFLYYLFDGKRFDDGKRYAMYRYKDENGFNHQIHHDLG